MSRLCRSRAVILMYHSVVEDPRQTANSIRISQSRYSFEWQMQELSRHFHVTTIDEVVDFALREKPLPARSVVVTFDDGFADNHDVVMPILRRYGIPATFYVLVDAVETGTPPWYCRVTFAFSSTVLPRWTDPNTGRVFPLNDSGERSAAIAAAWDLGAALTGHAQDEAIRQIESSLEVEPLGKTSRLMMNWDEVRALKRDGHVIGGHTLSHPNLAHVPVAEARQEMIGCKKALEIQMNSTVPHFSYPHPALNPQWTPDTLQIAREAGFRSAVLTTPGAVQAGDDPLTLMRIPADEDSRYWQWRLERAFLGNAG